MIPRHHNNRFKNMKWEMRNFAITVLLFIYCLFSIVDELIILWKRNLNKQKTQWKQ